MPYRPVAIGLILAATLLAQGCCWHPWGWRCHRCYYADPEQNLAGLVKEAAVPPNGR